MSTGFCDASGLLHTNDANYGVIALTLREKRLSGPSLLWSYSNKVLILAVTTTALNHAFR